MLVTLEAMLCVDKALSEVFCRKKRGEGKVTERKEKIKKRERNSREI